MDPSAITASSLDDPTASPSLDLSGAALPPGNSEQEMQLASDAQKSYDSGEYSSAVSLLSSLKSTRPDDALVSANLILAKFKLRTSVVASRPSTSGEMGLLLTELASQLEDMLKPTTTASEFEPSDCAMTMYNLALSRFFAGDIMRSLDLVKKVEDSMEKSCVKVSKEIELRLRDLRVASTLAMNSASLSSPCPQLEDLLLASEGGDRQRDSLSKLLPPSSFLLLAHFQRLLNARQVKAFRKDSKLASSLGSSNTVIFDFMRANMEYLKGNHKKAIKLLQNLKVEDDQKWLNLSLPTLTSNALGCVHLTMGKPETALFHLKSAINAHQEAIRSESFRQRQDMLHQVHRNRLVYNAAVCLLHRGQHSAAFLALKALAASPTMAASPHLWLRMAECCIAENIQSGDGFDELTDSSSAGIAKNSSVKLLGERENRKLILQQQQQQQTQPSKQQGKSAFGNGSDSDSNGKLNLLQASSCLKKAAYLLTDILLETKPNPVELKVTSRLVLLRANILLKQSYVLLVLDSHCESLRYAMDVLTLDQKHPTSLPSGLVALARLYAGESLIFLDRISEATEFLDPNCVGADVSFGVVNGGEDSSSNNNNKSDNNPSPAACRAAFTYNLAVAFLTRGELEKAEEMLEALWNTRSTHLLREKVLSAKLYVQLKRGKVAECRRTIKSNYTLEK